MSRRFKVGDHVTWNSEAGHVSGTIIRMHTSNVDYKGYAHTTRPRMNHSMRSGATSPITWPCTRDRR